MKCGNTHTSPPGYASPQVLRKETAAGRVQPHTAAQQSDTESSGAGVCRAYAGQAAGEHAFKSVRSSQVCSVTKCYALHVRGHND